MVEVSSLANKLGVFGVRGCGAPVSGRNRSLLGRWESRSEIGVAGVH